MTTGAARADVVIAGEALATKVSAYQGIVAWDSSRYSADGLSRPRRIRVQNGGSSVELPVADGVQHVIAPVLTADAIYYARWRNDAVGRDVRRSLSTNARSSAPGPIRGWRPTTLAIDGSSAYYTTLDGQLGTCGGAGGDHVSPPPFSAANNHRYFVRHTALPSFG